MLKELGVGTSDKKKKKFLHIKTLFITHIWNKKKYLFHTFEGGGGVPPDGMENSILFFYSFIEPFPKYVDFE